MTPKARCVPLTLKVLVEVAPIASACVCMHVYVCVRACVCVISYMYRPLLLYLIEKQRGIMILIYEIKYKIHYYREEKLLVTLIITVIIINIVLNSIPPSSRGGVYSSHS